MADSNLLVDFDNALTEDTVGLANVQLNFTEESDYVKDYEVGVDSQAQALQLTGIDSQLTQQESAACVNLGYENSFSDCSLNIDITKVSDQQTSAVTLSQICNNLNYNADLEMNNDSFVSDLYGSAKIDSNCKEILNIPSVSTLCFKYDNKDGEKEDKKSMSEAQVAFDALDRIDDGKSANNETNRERVYEDNRPRGTSGNRQPSSPLTLPETFNSNKHEVKNSANFVRHSRSRKTRPFQLTVKFSHMTNSKTPQKGSFNCDQCSKTFKFNTGLDRHMQKCHNQCHFFQCDDCAMVLNNKASLVKHILTHLGPKIAQKSKHTQSYKRTELSTKSPKRCLKKNIEVSFVNRKSNRIRSQRQRLNPYRDKEQLSKEVSKPDTDISDVNAMCKADIPNAKGQAGTNVNEAMDTGAMETKMAEMCSVGTKLVEVVKGVSFSAEDCKVVSQLNEISTLATKLATVSSNVLRAFKLKSKTSLDSSHMRSSKPSASAHNNFNTPHNQGSIARAKDDDNDNEDGGLESPSLNDVHFDTSTAIKEEIQDTTELPPEHLSTQVHMELKNEALAIAEAEGDILKPENFQVITSKFGEKQLQCTQCQKVFSGTRSLKRHIMVHNDIRPYSCKKCHMSFRRREHLKNHMVTHSEVRPFTCSQCPYTAKTMQRLKTHVLSHLQPKSFACSLCSYTSRTQSELKNHIKRHQTHKCNQCDFVCYTRKDLKKHMATHTALFCKDCDFSTPDQAEYAKHMRKHYDHKVFCCELCGYSCNSVKKFKYHMLRHENKTPFQCDECDYKCSSRASFDCHRLKHQGLKPFLCSFCGASFRKTSHLNQHLLIHKEEKAYKCSQCSYSCRTKHNLKEHEMTHSGEKPFRCKFCNFSCRRRKALQVHMEKHGPQFELSTEPMPSSLPPPYQVNLSVPMMPTLPHMQLTQQVEPQSSSIHVQVPLQVPMIHSVM